MILILDFLNYCLNLFFQSFELSVCFCLTLFKETFFYSTAKITKIFATCPGPDFENGVENLFFERGINESGWKGVRSLLKLSSAFLINKKVKFLNPARITDKYQFFMFRGAGARRARGTSYFLLFCYADCTLYLYRGEWMLLMYLSFVVKISNEKKLSFFIIAPEQIG